MGEVKKEILMLMKRTLESLYKAIDVAIGGNRIGDIGFAIQEYVEGFGYSVVRDLVGHGLGKTFMRNQKCQTMEKEDMERNCVPEWY